MESPILVFGSNLEGRHGKGAALEAVKNHGAIYGQAYGLQGRSFAIPTKATPYQSLTLHQIRENVDAFLDFAKQNPEMLFNVTPIGCGLAGYSFKQIAPMFIGHTDNVRLPKEFLKELNVS
jgi:hypothetical protein